MSEQERKPSENAEGRSDRGAMFQRPCWMAGLTLIAAFQAFQKVFSAELVFLNSGLPSPLLAAGLSLTPQLAVCRHCPRRERKLFSCYQGHVQVGKGSTRNPRGISLSPGFATS